MIWLSVAGAAVAVFLLVGPPPVRRLAKTLAESHAGIGSVTSRPPGTPRQPRSRPSSPRRWGWWLGVILGLGALILARQWAGPSAAVVGAAVLIVVATCVRLGLQFIRARAASQARVDIAHACSVLASQIRVGRVPAEALQSAAGDCPVLLRASRAQDLGADVTAIWREGATVPGHSGLADLARAWQVSSETGAPLAHSLEQVSTALAADVALRTVVAGELSAPRATGKIMAVLPLFGLGMGYLLGGDPVAFLLSSPVGWGCLVLGVALAAAGVLWIDRLAQVAGEQG